MSSNKHSVLLVDDHPIVAASTRSLLEGENHLEVVGVKYSAEELFSFLSEREPDLLILDVSLPDIDGFEICKRLKQQNTCMKVIIYTMHNIPRFNQYFYENGANGFVLKSGEFGDLIDAINQVIKGNRYFPGRDTLDLSEGDAQTEENQIQITDQERQLIILLEKNYSTLEIERQLKLSKTEIFSLRKSLLFKVNVSNTQNLIRKAKYFKWI
mgnify:CR=1 FL=1